MTETDGTDDGGERIARRMARAGVASRRAAEAMIAEGRVSVNGRVIDSPALNVTARDRIMVDGEPLAPPEPPRLWRYYKPLGLVTSERDEKGRETVFDRLPEDLPRVVSVGRLDLNSEGLLLLTNDGALKRRLELPSTGWLRKYRVRAHGDADDAMLEPLRRGIVVDGERFQPMTVGVDRKQGSNVWLTVALREGKNREVRRALDAIGLQVNRLIRVSYGPFQLGELEPGQVEEVRPKAVREQLGLGAATGGAKARGRPTGGETPDGGLGTGTPTKGRSAKAGPGKGGSAKGGPPSAGTARDGAAKGRQTKAGARVGRTGGYPAAASGAVEVGRPDGKVSGRAASKSTGKLTGGAAGKRLARPAAPTTKPGDRRPEGSGKPHGGTTASRQKPADGGRGKPAPRGGKPLTPPPRRPK
jgi:23S rRNA pseudouridine2605 synthase